MKIAKNDLVWWAIGIAILILIIYVTISSMTGNVIITGTSTDENLDNSESPAEKGTRYTEVTINTNSEEVVNS